MIYSILSILGVIAYLRMPVDLLPGSDSGVLTIFIGIRGGLPPEDIESLVTKPVEDEMATLPNLESVTSVSRKERAVITLSFKIGTDSARAALEVQERLAKIRGKLPRDIEKPVVARYDESQSPVIIFALSSKHFTPEQMRTIADDSLKPLLLQQEGVANVEIGGGRERKILVEFDKTRLESYALPIRQVIAQIGQENLMVLAGKMEDSRDMEGVRVGRAFKTVEEIRNLPIAVTKEGSRIYLKDAAEIRDFYMDAESYSRLNREPVVSAYVQKEAQANTVRMAEKVKEASKAFVKELDPRISFSTVSDQSVAVQRALDNVKEALLLGALLAGAVLLFFLKDFLYSSFIFISIPLSLILSGVVMAAFGLTLNVMTISGLAIATGMVVDDSIVVLENILHRRKRLMAETYQAVAGSRSPMMIEDLSGGGGAAGGVDEKTLPLAATREMSLALAASTLTRVIVFLPILFMNPQVRALYSGLAVTVTAALLFSLLVSVTVIPSLASNVPSRWIKESARKSIYAWLYLQTKARAVRVRLGEAMFKSSDFLRRKLRKKQANDTDMLLTHRLREDLASSVRSSGPLLKRATAIKVMKILFMVFIGVLLAVFVYGLANRSYQYLSLKFGWLLVLDVIFSRHDAIQRVLSAAAVLLAGAMGGIGLSLYRYAQIAGYFLRKRVWMAGVTALALLDCGILYRAMDKEFAGTTEEKEFTIFVELPSGARLEVSDKIVQGVEKVLTEMPEIQKSVKTSIARVEGWSSKIYVTLVPSSERSRSAAEIIAQLRPLVKNVGQEHDAFIYFSEPVSSKEFLIDVYGNDYGKLRDAAVGIAKRLESVAGLADIKLRYKEGRPEVRVELDRQRAASLEFSVQDVAESLHAQVRGLRATYLMTPTAQVETVARLQEQYRKNLEDVQQLTLVNRKGLIISMRQFAAFNYGLTPSEIWRKDRERMIQVSASRGDLSLTRVATEVEKALRGFRMPIGYYFELGGDFPKLVETEKESRLAFILMIALIYAVLASLFESYVQPGVILTAVPLTMLGAVPLLFVTQTPVTLGALIGFIMLGGIAVGNSIILVDLFNSLRKKMGYFKALLRAGEGRIRPILMTSLTAILGLLPLVFDREGAGSLWAPLAVTVIGGLSASTVLVLFILPGLYHLTQDCVSWVKIRFQ